jgi:hypothetical protein
MGGAAIGLAWFAGGWGGYALSAMPTSRLLAPLAATLSVITVVFLIRGLLAIRRSRKLPASTWPRARVRRMLVNFVAVVVAEVVAVAIVAWILVSLHLNNGIPAAVAIVVGVHFLPLAQVFDVGLYRYTAIVFCVVGVATAIALVVGAPSSWGVLIPGWGCALALWWTCHLLIQQIKHASPKP